MAKLTLVIVVLALASVIQSEVFTNPFLLKSLFLAEDRVVSRLNRVAIQDNEELKEKIARYLQDQHRVLDQVGVEDLSTFDSVNADDELMLKVVGNGIHVFRLCHRLIRELPDIVQKLDQEVLSREKESVTWATATDLVSMALALTTLKNVYLLNPLELAQGRLGAIQSTARLSWQDLVWISDLSLDKDEFADAIEWREAALSICKESSSSCQDIQESLQTLRQKHDDTFEGLEPNEKHFISKIGGSNKTGRDLRVEEDQYFLARKTLTSPFPNSFNNRNFCQLCRGLKLNLGLDHPVRLSNFCRYWSRDDPYLILMPLKVEVLSEEPLLHVYHDVVSHSEIELIKTKAQDLFVRAATENVADPLGKGILINMQRTQSNGWLRHDDPVAKKIATRLNHVTGLEVDGSHSYRRYGRGQSEAIDSEALQVGIYGPGGLYMPHYDAFKNVEAAGSVVNDVWVGNRVATAMLYLSELEGGGTVFPKIGTAAFPRKGSIVFWFNLLKSGDLDQLSLHGACPSLHGIKWVANRWIREGSQIFKHPCRADPQQRMK